MTTELSRVTSDRLEITAAEWAGRSNKPLVTVRYPDGRTQKIVPNAKLARLMRLAVRRPWHLIGWTIGHSVDVKGRSVFDLEPPVQGVDPDATT